MKGQIQCFDAAGRPCAAYLSPDYRPGEERALIVACCGNELPDMMGDIARLTEAADTAPFVMVSPGEIDWDRDYTPWPSAQLPGREMSGGGDAFFAFIRDSLLPQAALLFPGRGRLGVLGYSLGGLFALYAAARADSPFDCAASLSGALWYENFDAWLHGAGLPRLKRVYLSLGRREARGGRGALGSVGEKTQAVCALLAGRLGEDNVSFEWNNGNHFFQIPERIAKALVNLCKL